MYAYDENDMLIASGGTAGAGDLVSYADPAIAGKYYKSEELDHKTAQREAFPGGQTVIKAQRKQGNQLSRDVSQTV